MDFNKRKDLVFIILAGFFITNAIVAELIGGKLIQFFGLFTQSIGIILWPLVFVLLLIHFWIYKRFFTSFFGRK
jgi:purine-cytosine permease-like protein